MAEGFELVRNVRQHLRRSATLLDQGNFEDALAEANSALALDPQSLSAQALRDRIKAAQAAHSLSSITPAAHSSKSFVPHGVNAASWRGFEQRITERRFKALLDTINTSIVAGDGIAARTALEEARELRPDAPELTDFSARVGAMPVAAPAVATKAAPRIWMRAMGAAALFLLGVSLLLGLEWMRPEKASSAPAPVSAPAVPAVAPTPETRPAPSPDLGPVPVAMNEEEESVPAIVTPPEPLLRPAATTGTPPPEIVSRPVAIREMSPPIAQRNIDRRPVEEPPASAPLGEVSDDFVAPSRTVAAAAPDAGPAVAPPSAAADTPVTAESRLRVSPPADAVASSVSMPSAADQGRVEEVLRRYARAYGQLDAGAARAVWPTVDERALARAFQNLSSQKVTFNACDINIRGVTANASCRGEASYAPKVGNREPRTDAFTWRFELRRDGDAWKIEGVDARRQSTVAYRDER